MRTSRCSASKDYFYVYNGDKLTQLTIVDKSGETATTTVATFTYDAAGTPLTISYGGNTYYYTTNIQGDVTGIYGEDGTRHILFQYDGYGKSYYIWYTTTGSELLNINPLGYRSYVMDTGTGLYYLQSRYYNPELGRFINADSAISGSGGELLGHNQFAYCFNNPINMDDSAGNWPTWSNLTKGATWLTVGIAAICAGVSVLTCGVAAPVMMAVAAVTIGAGALTAINGAAEVGEAFTGYNVVRDTVFNGNQVAYDNYSNTTSAVAKVGTAICGGWTAKNSPRINAYKSMDTYNVKNKHLSTGKGTWNKFDTTSQTELRSLGKEILKNSPMNNLEFNSADSFKIIYDFGRVIGTSGETSARLVFSNIGKIITFFPE